MATNTQESTQLPLPIKKHKFPMTPEVARSSQVMGVAATGNPPTLDKEEDSIIFINAWPTLPREAIAHWAKLRTEIECTTSFCWVKGAVAVEEGKRQGKLPTGSDIGSIIKRNNYRIQVIDFTMQDSGSYSSSTDLRNRTEAEAERLSTRATTNNVKHLQVRKD